MSREIKNVSVWGLVKYHPQNFVDKKEAGIEMGTSKPFTDGPIVDAKRVADTDDYERLNFTPRLVTTKCSDSKEVRAIKKKLKR